MAVWEEHGRRSTKGPMFESTRTEFLIWICRICCVFAFCWVCCKGWTWWFFRPLGAVFIGRTKVPDYPHERGKQLQTLPPSDGAQRLCWVLRACSAGGKDFWVTWWVEAFQNDLISCSFHCFPAQIRGVSWNVWILNHLAAWIGVMSEFDVTVPWSGTCSNSSGIHAACGCFNSPLTTTKPNH